MAHLKGCPAHARGHCLCLLIQGVREDAAIDMIVRAVDTYNEYEGEVPAELRRVIAAAIDTAWEPRFIYSRDRHSAQEE